MTEQAGLYGDHIQIRKPGIWAATNGMPVVHCGNRVLVGSKFERPGTRIGDQIWATSPAEPCPGKACDASVAVEFQSRVRELWDFKVDLPVYTQRVVFIFDECHRSQFGEAQKNLKRKFKQFCQFGFTGTPIFPENASGAETTASVFGSELHSYVITDAIRDEKVLKFKVDYNDVRPQFKAIETEQDENKLTAAENRQALQHPARIAEISQYILDNFRRKTHRLYGDNKGFNAMFAVSSVDAAKLYYEKLNALQEDSDKPLKIATIFSFAANEEQDAIGDIPDESFEVSALNSSAKEFLNAAITDYNACFRTNFSVDSKGFQNYYRDLAKRMKSKEVDLLIVVGMFLTGFDTSTPNTLFVDKNLRFHDLRRIVPQNRSMKHCIDYGTYRNRTEWPRRFLPQYNMFIIQSQTDTQDIRCLYYLIYGRSIYVPESLMTVVIST